MKQFKFWNVVKILSRVLVMPVVAIVVLIAFLILWLERVVTMTIYGFELIGYERDERKMISDIYQKLKENEKA